jgi:hypothetical protein
MNSKLFLSLLASVFFNHWGMAQVSKQEQIIKDALKVDNTFVNYCYLIDGKERHSQSIISQDDISQCRMVFNYDRIIELQKDGIIENFRKYKMKYEMATIFVENLLKKDTSMGKKCVMALACQRIPDYRYDNCDSKYLKNYSIPLPILAPKDACMKLLQPIHVLENVDEVHLSQRMAEQTGMVTLSSTTS